MKKDTRPPETSYMLRLLGGGYLIYLAWDLRTSIGKEPLFLFAVIVFGLVGALLLVSSLKALAAHGYFRKNTEPETTEDCEERSDE